MTEAISAWMVWTVIVGIAFLLGVGVGYLLRGPGKKGGFGV